MIKHEPGNFSECRCDSCTARRQKQSDPGLFKQPNARTGTNADDQILDLVQRQSVTLADLYRRGRAKGLLKGSKGY